MPSPVAPLDEQAQVITFPTDRTDRRRRDRQKLLKHAAAQQAALAHKRILWVMVFDILITCLETAGAVLSGGSLALWANALTGFYDAILLGLNWWGLGHEANGRPERAKKFARWSDVGLIAGYAAIVLWAGSKLLGDEPHHIDGTIVLVVSAVAAAVNYLSGRRLPRSKGNGGSARLKMFAGAAIALATIIVGLVSMYTNLWRIDPIVTMGIGVAVIVAAMIRLTPRSARNSRTT